MERLTEQKLKNKKFQRAETAILTTLASARELLSVSRLIRLAGISRSTLYRHHRTVSEIIPDYENYLLKRYRHIISRLMKNKSTHLGKLYERTLIFMITYQKILCFLLDCGNQNFTETMIRTLQPKLLATGKIPNSTVLDIYVKEVAAVIEQWQRAGFNKNEISSTLDKIAYLTDTARSRLGPIAI